jgi:hypothetical protein
MQILTPALVPVARAILAQQGADPNIIDNNGDLSAVGALGLFFNEAEVRTAVTPSIRFPISASGAPPSPAVQELLRQLQPSVILRGPAGEAVVAPYGMPVGQTSWLPIALVGLGAVAFIGWAIWGK